LAPTLSGIWQDMETWRAIPPDTSSKVIGDFEEASMARGKTIAELTEWRDKMIIKMLKLLYKS